VEDAEVEEVEAVEAGAELDSPAVEVVVPETVEPVPEWVQELVLATVPYHDFRSGSRSHPNDCQIDFPDRQLSRTVNCNECRWLTPNQSELDGLSAGRPVDPPLDLYQDQVFAVC